MENANNPDVDKIIDEITEICKDLIENYEYENTADYLIEEKIILEKIL